LLLIVSDPTLIAGNKKMLAPKLDATILLWWVSITTAFLCECNAWVTPTLKSGLSTTGYTSTELFSTPFELDYYEDSDNPFGSDGSEKHSSSLACPPDTKLVIGLNKYTHDTSLCAADAKTGNVLFAISKERLSRKKNDAGNVASMVEACLDALDLDYDDAIEKIVMNNHHHRILPLENDRQHLKWEVGLNINGGIEGDEYDDEFNLLDVVGENKMELSHHLAHAYSTATQAPFDKGMVVVMDGMGESYRTMIHAKKTKDLSYVSDLSFPGSKKDDKSNDDGFAFDCIPSDLAEQAQFSPFDWREAESVYRFEKKVDTIDLKPIFKRFTPERSPPTLYNHGFENMDSVGALYSRASSHIFGDWNACGKVMGLAPWMIHSWEKKELSLLSEKEPVEVKPVEETRRILEGTLYSEDEEKKFRKNQDVISGMPLIARSDADLFDSQGDLIPKRRYDFDDSEEMNSSSAQKNGKEARLPTKVALEAISLAYRIQVDIEDITMDFVGNFREKNGEKNLCIAGGVGLNSVLNGKLSRELGFENTFISPYPGDDGIAVGCCAYGLFGNEIIDKKKKELGNEDLKESIKEKQQRPPIWKAPLSPYLGPDPSEMAIKAAIDAAMPWLEVDIVRDEGTRLDIAVQEIEMGGIVALYHGRSELGPRALGHRSILADPRKKGLVRFINEHVKKRESFRPFAPSVLAEYASEWFEMEDYNNDNFSPFMSVTAIVTEKKRARIPAVTHVDGSSRLQTVTPEDEPLYHRLITKFFELTGVPMVLNTSFNTLPGEPIVESPEDAIRSFLCSMGSIEMLIMGDYVIKRKPADLRALLGEADKQEQELMVEPTCPKRSGPTTFETTFEADEDEMDKSQIITTTRVRMPKRPMHSDTGGAWFHLLDELEGELLSICDGSANLNEILAQYTAAGAADDEGGGGELDNDRVEETQVMLQNIVHRLVRLYEHTLISW